MLNSADVNYYQGKLRTLLISQNVCLFLKVSLYIEGFRLNRHNHSQTSPVNI